MLARPLIFAIILTAPNGGGIDAFSPSYARTLHHESAEINRCSVSRDVSLQMGVRSFITKKILRRDDDNDNEDDQSEKATTDIDLRTVLQSPKSSGLMESPVTTAYTTDEGNDVTIPKEVNKTSTSSKKRNEPVDDILTNDMKRRLQEDAKHRIQRVQAGGMTEEEKLSFLNTALTRTLPPKKPRGPPIRQKIPGLDEEEDFVSGSKGKKRIGGSGKSGSSKTDDLWSAITSKSGSSVSSGGKSEYVPVSSLILDGKLRNEEAKRQWIDSITSPDRFSSFSSIQRDGTESEETSNEEEILSEGDGETTVNVVDELSEESDEPDTDLGEQDFTQMKRKMMEDQQILLNKPKVEKPGEKSVRQALESILAMTSNKNVSSSNTTDSKNNDLAARLEKAAVEQENRDAENRIAAEKKKMEEKQALIKAQKEREAKFLREEAERMELARKKAEQARRDQEAKKEAERAKVEAAVAAQEEYWANQLKKQQAKREASMSVQERRAMEQKKINEAREMEEMFERDIAKDVKREQIREEEKMREPEHEGKILEEAEQEKLHYRDLARDIVDESAARVSRTAVKPSKRDASVSAFVLEQRRKKAEIDKLVEAQQQQLKMLSSPLTPPKKQPVRMAVPRTAPVPVKSSAPRPAPVPVRSPAPRPAPARSSISPEVSLSSLTLKKSAQSKASPNAPVVKRPVKTSVRQQLPISKQFDDDNDDDGDNLMKQGGAGLTVADALKQRKKDVKGDKAPGGKKLDASDRAKQWGIDMSKFN